MRICDGHWAVLQHVLEEAGLAVDASAETQDILPVHLEAGGPSEAFDPMLAAKRRIMADFVESVGEDAEDEECPCCRLNFWEQDRGLQSGGITRAVAQAVEAATEQGVLAAPE